MAIDRKRDTDTMTHRTERTLDSVMDISDTKEKRARKQRRVLSASTLAGDRVRNSAGEDLGKIEELMVDISTGRIAYAVLSFGGFLGMGTSCLPFLGRRCPWTRSSTSSF